jgi:hypothetical protein
MKVVAVSIPWFSAEEWPKLLAVAADRAALHDTHAEFERHASVTVERMRAEGQNVVKTYLFVAELVAWCQRQRRPVDARPRAEFAGIVAWRKRDAH